jgi:glycosyltransferase involved in cell wall biosynthesis
VVLAKGREDLSGNILIQKIQLVARRLKLEKLRRNPQIIDRDYLKKSFDIEIAMTYNDFEPVLNSSNKKSKKIGWFHSEINERQLAVLVPQILKQFPQFDHMVYCSENIRKLMHREHPNLAYPPESVITNAVSTTKIRRKADGFVPEMPSAPVFVAVGRLNTRKGFHKLMEAHAKLILEGFQHAVMIIGDGEERANLFEQRKKLNVEETFILAGNQMNPYPYIKNADFFILPSESEAWPLVIAEALILQKPIIATDTGDVGLMIKNRETGSLVRYDADELYKAMREFLTDKKLVSGIQKNLLNIDSQFDNEKIFREIEKLLINAYQTLD